MPWVALKLLAHGLVQRKAGEVLIGEKARHIHVHALGGCIDVYLARIVIGPEGDAPVMGLLADGRFEAGTFSNVAVVPLVLSATSRCHPGARRATLSASARECWSQISRCRGCSSPGRVDRETLDIRQAVIVGIVTQVRCHLAPARFFDSERMALPSRIGNTAVLPETTGLFRSVKSAAWHSLCIHIRHAGVKAATCEEVTTMVSEE